MRRREFIVLMGASVTWPFAAMGQQPGRTYRLGFLVPDPRDAPINLPFFDQLRRRGFIEGQNLAVEYRAFGQHVDLISQYAAELVRARVDVRRPLNGANCFIPCCYDDRRYRSLRPYDMLGSGLVNSLARPDGNTTGVNILASEADGKRQDILIEVVPSLRLMAVLVDVLADVNSTSAARLDALREAARAQYRVFNSSCRQRRGDRGSH
jgi:putative ABC transport system substrate-binding protein